MRPFLCPVITQLLFMKKLLLLSVCLLIMAKASFSQKTYQQEIQHYADELYQSFNKLQQRSALLAFSDTARIKWNNLPVGLRARAGTSIGNMTEEQRMLLHRILSASLSSQGYLKATSILHLDDLLNRYSDSLYARKAISERTYEFMKGLLWSHKNFFFAFFGKPTDPVWGYKLEGHHLSINFTFSGDTISVTPFFIGTDPAEYTVSEYAGWRVLGQEEDLGVRLMQQLSTEQQAKAVKSEAVPKDIITAAESGRRLIDYWGLPAKEMTAEQQTVLQHIIREFVFNLEYEKAVLEYDKIVKAGIENIYFGWIGAKDEYSPHYFVINGPTFLIEFDNNGGPRNGANHIHAIWREKGNEYGEDVLKKHYLLEKH